MIQMNPQTFINRVKQQKNLNIKQQAKMQKRCPIQGCGRQFENELTMIEHVRRRHPEQSEKIKQQATNQMLQKQTKITQEMNKLPKMQRVIQMSKEKKTLEFQRRSSSKKKIIINPNLNSTLGSSNTNLTQNQGIPKVSDIIAESRQLLEDSNPSTKRLIKRPSLVKKTSEEIDTSKFPSILPQAKVKKLKLQSLKSDFSSTTLAKQSSQKQTNKINHSISSQNQQTQSHMYSTAPNFTQQMNRKIELIRSRGKKQGEVSNRSSSKDLKVEEMNQIPQKKRITSQNLQNLINEQKGTQSAYMKPSQRPIKKLLQRSSRKEGSDISLLNNQKLSESTFIQKPSSQQIIDNKKTFSFQQKGKLIVSKGDEKKFIKKQKSQQGSPKTQQHIITQAALERQLNWQQRTVTVRNQTLQHFRVPQFSEVQYLYITNCQLQSIDLNECFSLISLTLNQNQLKDFSFLQPTVNGQYQNIEEIYLDHNIIESISSLPSYLSLRKLSLSFNQVKGIDEVTKALARFPLLEELDLSFNPVRKQPNYKLAVLAVCKGLKKLDGMVVTKFDRQMAAQYHKMYFDYLKIIPLSNSALCEEKFRPSTAISINSDLQTQDNTMPEMTQQQLTKEIQILEKLIKNTKDQYEIIQEQNKTLDEEIQTYQKQFGQKQETDLQFNPKLYAKLCKEVEELEMLNFLQYASEKELLDILLKKAKQKGLGRQILTAN